jgi:hypothetical protein
MTFTEAAAHVLRLVGKPLHYKEITDIAIEKGILSHVGKSPEVTMGARLAAQVKKASKDNPLSRVKPGVFALAEWDEKMIEDGLADRTPVADRVRQAGEPQDDAPDSDHRAHRVGSVPLAVHRDLDEEDPPPDEDEQRRAQLSASATDLFESEDDDDQPIFGGPAVEQDDARPAQAHFDGDGDRSEGKRRRRRRRGRGRKEEEVGEESDDLPTYTVSDALPEDLPEAPDDAPEWDDQDAPSPISLASSLEQVLSRYDRSKGPVAAQNLADALRRKANTEASLGAAGIIAIAVADNLAAERQSRPPRFRVSGNKLALSAWSVDRRLIEKQVALGRAADQLREATVRALSEELRRLPQRSLGELVLVLLARMGVTGVSSVRRPGAHGSELHLCGIVSQGGLSIPTAIMVRRDGKDIGRERVTELRGALHHYGQASCGWVISTGQVLSGAREEAGLKGASPVALTGRNELAELLVVHGVGVRMQRVEIPTLDAELFESLQGR